MAKIKKNSNFTEGKVFFKILLFILPIVATNLLQAFYNAADMMVVSLSHEENAVGAIGTTGSFINLIVNLFIGFSVGANVVVAREIGAKNPEGIQKAVHTSLMMGLIFGVLGMVLGLVIAKPVMVSMGNADSLLTLSVRYCYFYFLGIPFVATTNYLMAIFRAKGDSKTPLVVLTGSGILNVSLNMVFVLVLGMSVEGVAIATTVANAVSTVVLLIKLCKADDDTRFSWKNMAIDKRAFRDITVNGLPAGIQGALFSLSNMTIQSSIVQVNNAICPDASYAPIVDGNAAAANLEGFIYVAMSAVYQGSITFTSQNIGANKPRRVYRILWSCEAIVIAIGMFVAGLVYFFQEPLLGLYGVELGAEGSLQRLAYETTQIRFQNICLLYWICGMMDVCTGTLRGLGKSVTSMMISLVGVCLVRVLWIWFIFPLDPTLDMIYVSYPISWAATFAVALSVILVSLRKLVKKQPQLA